MSKDLTLDGIGAPEPAAQAAPLTAEALFAEHGAFAWRLLRRLGVADSDADDACQEVFLTVHRRLPHFEGRSSPRSWVYGICVRVAADHRKRVATRREVTSEAPPEGRADARQEHDAAVRQALAILDGVLGSLDDDRRAVFVLYEIEDLTLAEIAVALGCPLQTAYSRLQAARQDVQAALRRRRASEGRHE